MLGWMIKRGLDGGRDGEGDPDDTQYEQPDTPGPVFAARALKSAIFGTPARPDSESDQPAEEQSEQPTRQTTQQPTNPSEATPNVRDRAATGRLPGILLTPGTATSRRKRVSFGHNVEYDENDDVTTTKTGKKLFGDDAKKPKTTLAQALENARQQNNKAAAAVTAADTAGTAADDNAWEEEVDDNDNNSNWDPDVTVDLNEPHSQSGRYWKSQFQRYQEDAKAEMSKLLKYKQLAKSYAKMKDSEAGDMHAKLREEKEKVVQMEARITELAGQIARQRTKGTTDRDYQELISDLTRQTALAVQYRNQVKELEAMLQDADADDVFRQHGDGSETSSAVAGRRRGPSALAGVTSPRTQKTLLDTQRELRRARDQARELEQVKDEVRRLKTALRAAEQRANNSESESRALAADLASSVAASEAATSRIHDLEKRATFAEDERRRKDDELRLLQSKYDELKEDAKARVGEAEQVLRRKNEQIAELKRQVKRDDLAATAAPAPAPAPASLAALEQVTRSRYESLANRRSLDAKRGSRDVGAVDVVSSKANGLDRNETADEPELPQQKIGRQRLQPQKDEPIAILEDDTSHFELPPIKPRGGTRTATARLRRDERRDNEHTDSNKNDTDAVAAANRILLRRRRTLAVPLRPTTETRHNGLVESKLAARKRLTTSAVVHNARFPSGDAEHADPVTAAAAAAADASSLSISSSRAAAAVARIEQRRAQRQRELGLQQNKENMQPA